METRKTTTKRAEWTRYLKALSERFNTTVPSLCIGQAGGRVLGTYFKSETKKKYVSLKDMKERTNNFVLIALKASITMQPYADLETLLHEFAHHLDEHRSFAVSEPPRTLTEVREALPCSK